MSPSGRSCAAPIPQPVRPSLRSRVVEPGPVPPHERAWRHPSELGPPAHEPTTTTGRILIVTSAAVGLLMVGILAVAMTPSPLGTPTAVESTATPLRGEPVGVAPELVTTAAVTETAMPSATRNASPMAVVTPVGEEGLGVTTLDAVAGKGGTLTARLPSGTTVRIVVVGTDERSGLALVALPEAVGVAGGGFRMADEQADPDDTVVVQGVETTIVAVVELAHLEFAEGTPVLDDDGELVGLCSDAGYGTKLVPFAEDDERTTPSRAAPTTTPDTETAVATTEPTDDASTSLASAPPSVEGSDPASDSTEVSSSVAASGPAD